VFPLDSGLNLRSEGLDATKGGPTLEGMVLHQAREESAEGRRRTSGLIQCVDVSLSENQSSGGAFGTRQVSF
jgi:hypothetical protein